MPYEESRGARGQGGVVEAPGSPGSWGHQLERGFIRSWGCPVKAAQAGLRSEKARVAEAMT